ncbi:DNA repair protein RecO [Paludibacterium yongneupense]|uniref:DNA repair protein RecO n=1 Tax=Paludibacterium yongneupense TaxID=400061 RepID=UPI0003F65BA3|nr:DNA repair protein RecO [Paludibacterium yongneupense]
MSSAKVDRQLAYVLHTQPYRETSLLVDALTAGHGRVTLVARGARRPRAELRGLLLPFQPLSLSWFGKGDVRTLHSADWLGGLPQLGGLPLLSGFYLNELVLKLTVRDDPHAETWQVYDRAVRGLASGAALAEVLRRFELGLVRALGYAPPLDLDAAGERLDATRFYRCRPGMAPLLSAAGGDAVSGATLLSMAADDFSDATMRREARRFLRMVLNDILDGQPLATRDLLQSLTQASEQEWGAG